MTLALKANTYLWVELNGSYDYLQKCNGTQHWTTILHDRVGGSLVGMVDTELPSDLYTTVLDDLINILEVEVKYSGKDEKRLEQLGYAVLWKGHDGITRKMVKTPVMTSTYSAGLKAFRKYISEYCISKGIVFSEKGMSDSSQRAYQKKIENFLVTKIVNAIDNTIQAKAGMVFVKNAIRDLQEVHWKTKAGFHVYLHTPNTFAKTFAVRVDGHSRHVTFRYNREGADLRAHQTGIAPDLIHSQDATHMVITINNCPEVTHWHMVHDQFSCHGCFVQTMTDEIRNSFVELYPEDEDFLLNFQEQINVQREKHGLPLDEQELPEYGDLRVTEVLTSKYFFG